MAKGAGRVMVVLGLLGTAIWGAKAGLRQYFIENEEFRLSVLDLETNGAFGEADFARVTGIDPTSSVFALNLGELREELESYACVVRAELSRRLPGTLRVRVEERIPVAWIECRPLGIVGRDPEAGLLVDAAGVCFPCAPWWDETAKSLPVILVSQADEGDLSVGKRVRHHEARRALELIKLSREQLAGEGWGLPVVAVCNDYSLLAGTSTGVLATFGMYDHERQLADLRALAGRLAHDGEQMVSVNLIPERNIPVRVADGPRTGDGTSRGHPPLSRLEREVLAILDGRNG
jgi:cell division protein FtsQ